MDSCVRHMLQVWNQKSHMETRESEFFQFQLKRTLHIMTNPICSHTAQLAKYFCLLLSF